MLDLESGVVLGLGSGIALHSLPDQDRYYAFNIIEGIQFRLNHVSYWVLETIRDTIEWGELKAAFLENFDVPPCQGEESLKKILSHFHKENVIGRENYEDQEENDL